MARTNLRENDRDNLKDALNFIETLLPEISRTFAFTVPKLPKDLCFDLTAGYTVCRVIDTIEDSAISSAEKKTAMRVFLEALKNPSNSKIKKLSFLLTKIRVSHKGYQKLLNNLSNLFIVFKSFPRKVQEIVLKFSSEMADGFAVPEVQKIRTIEDQNRYCHYAAGVVGYMITELFSYRGYISNFQRSKLMPFAHCFGLALQKVNIIKDVFKDVAEGRKYWPEEIIRQHGLVYEDFFKQSTKDNESKFEKVLNVLLKDAKNYIDSGVYYIDNLPYKPPGLRICCGDILMMAVATIRVVKESGLEKRKIEREEVYAIDRIATKLAENKESFALFAEHLFCEPAYSYSC